MATIKRYLSPKVANGVSEIFLRVSVARGKVWKFGSGVFINPARMRADGSVSYPRANQREVAELHRVEQDVMAVERVVYDFVLASDVSALTREMVLGAIERHRRGVGRGEEGRSFFGLFAEFLRARGMPDQRRRVFLSAGRCLYRYEVYRRLMGESGFRLDVSGLTAEDIAGFERFYRDEWMLHDTFPELYRLEYPAELRILRENCRQVKRGNNAAASVLTRLRSFYGWLNSEGYTDNRPFDRCSCNMIERYGTPFYLTIEERDRIADFDLSDRRELAVQRDIFVFQCLVGCRVSDLQELRVSNVVGDAIEYVAKKTRNERSSVIRVPLGRRARALIDRYAGRADGRLFPFEPAHIYNNAIKSVCMLCGIDRVVTVIDSKTGQDVRRHIYEVATSHMARRTFVGNLYKRVKDPNLVGALSGHKEGSKAFARYREIDDEMKRELIDLID